MKRFELTRSLFGADITAEVMCLEHGIHVSLYGGTLPHIGAVSVISPEGALTTHQFPGHKEGVVSEGWAKAISEAGHRPVVVEAGIHYDQLTREGISAVLELTERMLSGVVAQL